MNRENMEKWIAALEAGNGADHRADPRAAQVQPRWRAIQPVAP